MVGTGGMLHLTVGSGKSGAGGDAKVLVGETSAGTGGSLTLHTGYGSKSISGNVSLQTLDAGTKGVSGALGMSSGAAGGIITLSGGSMLDRGTGGSVAVNAGFSA